MTDHAKHIPLALMLAASATIAHPARAQDDPPSTPTPPDLARAAALYDEQKYDDALAALGDDATSPHAALARGTTLAAAARLDEAADVLRDLAAAAADPAIAHHARFNLGSVLLRKAMATPQEAAHARIQALADAADQFLAAARLDPADIDAVRNLELARRTIDELQRQQQEQQQQQDQQQQQQQQQGDGDPQDGQQGEQSDQNQSQQNQNQQNQQPHQPDHQNQGSPQSQAQQAAQELQDQAQRQAQESQQNQAQSQSPSQGAKDQRELSDQAEQTAQDLENLRQELQRNTEDSGKAEQHIDNAQDALDRARQAQEDAQRALEQGDQREAAQKQQEAAQQLMQAAQLAQQAADAAAQDANDAADPLVQQLLDREKEQRERRARVIRGTPVPVEKDW